jgi:hypothetical protein
MMAKFAFREPQCWKAGAWKKLASATADPVAAVVIEIAEAVVTGVAATGVAATETGVAAVVVIEIAGANAGYTIFF